MITTKSVRLKAKKNPTECCSYFGSKLFGTFTGISADNKVATSGETVNGVEKTIFVPKPTDSFFPL